MAGSVARRRRLAPLVAIAAGALLGARGAAVRAAPAPPAKPATPAAGVPRPESEVTLTPRGWKLSTYSFEGRFESGINDVTFEAPPAYQDSFKFWTDHMKQTHREEVIQLLTTTRDPDKDGSLPFRRQVSRYMVDLVEHGQPKEAGQPLVRAVKSLVWEGALDPLGNVREIRKVEGPENTGDVDRLGFPLLDHLFPHLSQPVRVEVGRSFTVEESMPLPSKLTIQGLEQVGFKLTRVLTLKEVHPPEATFDVDLSYAIDPATAPTAPGTTCRASGSGKGTATFNMDDGMFVSARMPAKMTMDIEAPLRPLPGQEGDPGRATTHVEMSLIMSGTMRLARLYDSEQPPPASSPRPDEPAGASPPPGRTAAAPPSGPR